jgi:hypothetical protein
MSVSDRVCTAEAVLEKATYSWVWIVTRCPYCGKRHEHYGGPLEDDPHKSSGIR